MSSDNAKSSSWVLISVILAVIIGVFLIWKYFLSSSDTEHIDALPSNPEVTIEQNIPDINNSNDELVEKSAQEFIPTEEISTLESVADVIEQRILPKLDNSDSWIKEKLTSIFMKKELLSLIVDDDMIRRFVVFVDNFSQGSIAYGHSPLVDHNQPFKVNKALSSGSENTWNIDDDSFKRFTQYAELLRSTNPDELIEYYQEVSPLIEEAYAELGYPDKRFKQTLQSAISKVLSLGFPSGNPELIRPSVMYRYKSDVLEELDDADKLMLRIGEDNLLMVKSVLTEVSEKINNIK